MRLLTCKIANAHWASMLRLGCATRMCYTFANTLAGSKQYTHLFFLYSDALTPSISVISLYTLYC
jgi:hypothetical protein